MSHNKIEVVFNGEKILINPGTNIANLLKEHPHKGAFPALGAMVNKRLMSINYQIHVNSEITTVDYQTKEGAGIYRRTMALVLGEAVCSLFPGASIEIGQSLGGGYYYDFIHSKKRLTPKMLEKIEAQMKAIISDGQKIIVETMTPEEAAEVYEDKGYKAKVMLLNATRKPEVRLARIKEFSDVLYGPIGPNTGICEKFELHFYKPGFILRFPDPNMKMKGKPHNSDKLFNTYKESSKWNEMLGASNIGQLNQACIDGSISQIIRVSEGFHEKKIANLADEIKKRSRDVKVVLIAGPSASGKTTFMKRLGIQLHVNGIQPVGLSLDNYYVNRDDTPRNKDGSYDFENIDALDIELLNEHMVRLLNGEEVQTPIYNFSSGMRSEHKTIPLKLKENQILTIEGIHGLNPRLSHSIEADRKFSIYVSALTQLKIDEHNRIFTSDTRLLRRMVRDRLYRNYNAKQTIKQWAHVRAGERKWLFPYQEKADSMFDTSLVYEQAVLKPIAMRFLMEVPTKDEEFTEAYRLFCFLDLFIPILEREVPPWSILREFIGGSSFEY